MKLSITNNKNFKLNVKNLKKLIIIFLTSIVIYQLFIDFLGNIEIVKNSQQGFCLVSGCKKISDYTNFIEAPCNVVRLNIPIFIAQQTEEQITIFRTLVNRCPDNMFFKFLLSSNYIKINDYKDAVPLLLQLHLGNQVMDASERLMVDNEDWVLSKKALDEIKDWNFINKSNWVYSYGLWFYRQQNWYEAEKLFNSGITQFPLEARFYIFEANILNELNNRDSAGNLYEEAKRVEPKNPLSYYFQALYLTKASENDKAIKLLNQAIQVDANYSQSYLLLSQIYYSEKNSSNAIYYALLGIKIRPESWYYSWLGQIYEELKSKENAVQIYCSAIFRYKDFPDTVKEFQNKIYKIAGQVKC